MYIRSCYIHRWAKVPSYGLGKTAQGSAAISIIAVIRSADTQLIKLPPTTAGASLNTTNRERSQFVCKYKGITTLDIAGRIT